MSKYSTITFCLLAVVVCDSTADEISFNRDIRPILSQYCFACHGPDQNHREADLRLDNRQAAVEHGAIVPGRVEQSSLIERIFSTDGDLIMPPAESGKTLSSQQKQLLSDWIQQGAEYQKHWSFEPVPDVVPLPDPSAWADASFGDAEKWIRNGIDFFVAAQHHRKGVRPNPEVDRATWLRRVTLDLTGLPPSLEELDGFLSDQSDDAYESVVDRLLSSPAYGERMANMWMDVARYADTFGYQSDVEMDVWPWRDWVIEAFNSNMPYDQFLTEQIAGDLLPNATQNQRLATTFNRLHRQTNEGGSVPEEFRLTGIADRTTTAGTAFLGLTLECCRCHDHKFDPISQREFYQLSAYFSDIDEFGLYAHFTRGRPTPAMLLYAEDERASHLATLQEIETAKERYETALLSARQKVEQQPDALLKQLPPVPDPAFHAPLEGTEDGVSGKATLCDGDQQIACPDAPVFGRTSPFTYSLWVRPAVQQPRMLVLHQSVAAEDSAFRGIQLTLDDGSPEFSMIHFWPGNAVRVQSRTSVPVNQWSHLAVTHDGSGTASGIRIFVNGMATDVDVERDKLTLDVRHRKEWGDPSVGSDKLSLGARFRDVGFRDGGLDELNVYDHQLSSAQVMAVYCSVRKGSVPAGISVESAIEHHLLVADESVRNARTALQKARHEENEFVSGIRQIMVMQHSADAAPTHMLARGEYTAKGEAVNAGLPQAAGTLSVVGEGRLQLANWMTHPNHPLTSRVIVNRMWHLFFGRGIVVTLEDFGSQGTPPSHPELLDYLSRDLIEHHWDLKSLCRKIVLSATYRQSSVSADAAAFAKDPDNIWLSRGPRHRLSAEQLRDSILAASGLLVRTIGGPSVMPYQPEGLWKQAGTGKTYHQSKGEGLYRRSLYTFWRRTAPPPSMLTFDATSRESCTARRELTTTPLQALVFLNDPQYVEAARVLAEKLILSHRDDQNARWNELFRRLLCRLPTDQERSVIDSLYQEQLGYFREDSSRSDEFLKVGERTPEESADRSDLAATSIVVQTLFAYDETIMLR
ncbi:MAG: DUF1553 domain-containing protein [Planctomycetaceae bacterium]|nr:DUF1553 domain-containing protein [Planctomycetaceae bacterium]